MRVSMHFQKCWWLQLAQQNNHGGFFPYGERSFFAQKIAIFIFFPTAKSCLFTLRVDTTDRRENPETTEESWPVKKIQYCCPLFLVHDFHTFLDSIEEGFVVVEAFSFVLLLYMVSRWNETISQQLSLYFRLE